MNPIDLGEIAVYVNENIDLFHARRLRCIQQLKLSNLVSKNPYLFRAKNMTKASELVEETMAAFLSSSEEKDFGDFLEGLAIFVASKALDGRKSASPGIDLELVRDGIHYVISIKSGTNWGNSSQQAKLADDFNKALIRLRQGRVHADAVLGSCYGKVKTGRNLQHGYLKLAGQNFWTFISGDKELYREIIEPIGYRAKEHNDAYIQQRDALVNLLTMQFIERFCDETGAIDWPRVVDANSGNYDLDKHMLDMP
ncbi:MAG: cytosolic protein [Candidatus Promineofilum sp.]|nr:cytosolic protein [Promineifilum sp.]